MMLEGRGGDAVQLCTSAPPVVMLQNENLSKQKNSQDDAEGNKGYAVQRSSTKQRSIQLE